MCIHMHLVTPSIRCQTIIYKILHRKQGGEGERRCSGSVNSSISTGGTRRFTLLANQVKSHEWVKHRGLWLRKTAQEPAYVAYQNNFA